MCIRDSLIYGDNPDQNILERAVRWVIILIVIVFDPLALTLILAANKQFEWARQGTGGWVHDESAQKIDPEPPGVEQRPLADLEVAALDTQVNTEPVHDTVKSEQESQAAAVLDEQQRAEAANNEVAKIERPESDLDIPVLENEEMWAQRVIDEQPKEEAKEQAKYQADNGALTAEQIAQVKAFVEDTPPAEAPAPIDEFNTPIRRGADYAVRYKGKVYNLDAFNKLYPSMAIRADNEKLEAASQCGFGERFPDSPMKGDMFIRTDYLPDRLFKWNGQKWIEVDKNSTDSYTYNQAYIQHLIQKLEAGEYEIEDLSDAEQAQVEQQIEQILKSKNG